MENDDKPEITKRPGMRQVEISRSTEALLDHYRNRFESMFREKPLLEEEDTKVAAWLVQQHEIAKAKSIVDLYLTHDDEWIQRQGYTLRLLRKNYNALFVKNRDPNSQGPLYMIAFSESGFPVTSRDPHQLSDHPAGKMFKPLPWEDWLKLPVEAKFMKPREYWDMNGYNTPLWLDIWEDNEWIPKRSSPVKMDPQRASKLIEALTEVEEVKPELKTGWF